MEIKWGSKLNSSLDFGFGKQEQRPALSARCFITTYTRYDSLCYKNHFYSPISGVVFGTFKLYCSQFKKIMYSIRNKKINAYTKSILFVILFINIL